MRILRIRIDSFGRLKDRDFVLGQGLNVFYGPNESGKTTTMEFIRSTLVPTKRRTIYPEKSKNDSGFLEIEDCGTRTVIEYSGKDDSNIPGCLRNLDPDLYRSIFAMNHSGLDDMDAVLDSDIRSRFLTIPGAESIPGMIPELEDDTKKTLGLNARSPSRINDIQAREDRIYARIAELKTNAESYSDLCRMKEELESELSGIKDSNRESEVQNEFHARVESVRPMFEDLRQTKERREDLLTKPIVSEEDIMEYNRLKTECNSAESAFRALESSRIGLQSGLNGCSETAARENRAAIREVLSRKVEAECPAVQQPVMERRFASSIVPFVFCILGVVLLIIPGIETVIKAAGAAALFAIAGIAFWKMRTPSRKHVAEHSADRFANEVSALMARLGLSSVSLATDLRRLQDIEDALRGIDGIKDGCSNMKIAWMERENELMRFLSRFGGENGYTDAVSRNDSLKVLDSRIESLKGNIVSAGFDPELPLPTVIKVEIDTSRQSEISMELGSITNQMKAVLNTEELDSLIDSAYLTGAEKDRALREGAVLMLSSYIIDKACGDLYKEVHPDVVSIADGYLSLMTAGRYSLDTDPRNTELRIISDGLSKGPKQWSTGLRAQVLLSLKLAVAKEMGGGEIPVILDDVLLPFDSERKAGACRALSILSEEMQVILFTCDETVARICGQMEGVNIIDL